MKKRTGIIALSALSLSAVAFAQNSTRPTPAKLVVNETQRTATAEFWTTDRLANAKAMPLPQVDPLSVQHTSNSVAPANGPRGILPGGRPNVHSQNRGSAEF
ncbi:MAG: hypothetical protein M3Y72_20875 [Acidobacteriota bacterium]|nr:hypothetical protein [Acidobacteriota bacterium]